MSAFIEEHRDRFGVEPICRTLEVSASTCHERRTGRRSARAIEDERLLERIREVHERDYCAYGYRRMSIALEREGEEVGKGRVQRLMREAEIKGAKRRGKPWHTTKADPEAQRRPDLVERDLTATAPDRLWVGDFTYLRCREGALFFSFVIDAFSRRVVGWQLASHMRTDLVLDALRMALGRRDHGADFALVAHTDRGSQYTSTDHTQELDDHGVLASVGSVGDAYDDAMAESLVDTFKTELIADRLWRSRSQLELAVVEYVAWFNNDRLHESLGEPISRGVRVPIRSTGGSTEQSLLNWKPTKTVSVEPGLAQTEIVRQAWRELPQGDRNLLERISADQWQVCSRPLGTYTDELLRSGDRGSLGESEIARANDALALWIPDLRVMLINESHPAFDGLDESSLDYDLSRVAWHEWGHALSIDRTGEDDIAAGNRYVELLPDGLAMFVRQAGYRRREYTHEVVAEIYAILMIRRRQGTIGRPPWLHPEVYELVRRVAGWNQ